MGLKRISTTSVLETGQISPLTVPDGGVVLSRPRPTLGCSAHDDDLFYSVVITDIKKGIWRLVNQLQGRRGTVPYPKNVHML
jgi:hypothetical protein